MDFRSCVGRTIICVIAGAAPVAASDQPLNADLDDLSAFFADATVIDGPELVDCKLSGGTETTCFSITVKAEPSSYTPGPWCPRNVTDGPDVSGIWLDGGKVHNADGAFMSNLATFYDDDNWQMADPDSGAIRVTDSRETCAAAARPDVGPEYQNFCVECLPEYMPDDATLTYTIPTEPHDVWRGIPTMRVGSGVAYNGIRLDGSAPVHAILGAYTIAPFDDCGGHVNLHVGYHYHAVTDCLDRADDEARHGTKVGIAMDGYAIFSHVMGDGTTPDGLDRCHGHQSEDLDYHYHAGAPGSNAILGCLSAEHGCVSEDPNRPCDATARPPRP